MLSSKARCLALAAFLTVIAAHDVAGDDPDAGGVSPHAGHRFSTRYRYYDRAPWIDLVEAATDAAGRDTRYAYNDRRELTGVEYPDGTRVQYRFDKFGRRTAMEDSSGTTSYQYDGLSRLARVDQANGLWARFEYDWQGRISAVVTPADERAKEREWRVEYRYDLLGQPVEIDSPVGRFTWERDFAAGTITRRLPNGCVTTFQYATDGSVSGIRHERNVDQPNGAGRVLLAEFSYAYLPGGRVSAETVVTPDGASTTGFKYDQVGRLVQVTLPDHRTILYEYDRMGNRLKRIGPEGTVEYTHDAWDQIQKAGDATFGHDALGNMAWRQDPGGMTRFEYDGAQRLVRVDATGGSVSFTYNGDGFLTSRAAGDSKSEYLVAPGGAENEFLVESAGDEGLAHFVRDERVLCRATAKSTEFYLEDRLGSTRLVVDASGTTTMLGYQPFGEPDVAARNSRPTVLFAGLWFDPAAGVYLTKMRAYEPTLGRFIQPETRWRLPSGTHEELMLYSYCGCDPLNMADRTGLFGEDVGAKRTDVPGPVLRCPGRHPCVSESRSPVRGRGDG